MSGEQIEPSLNLLEGVFGKKTRGRNKSTLKLIDAMYKIAEKAHPINGRGVGYKLELWAEKGTIRGVVWPVLAKCRP